MEFYGLVGEKLSHSLSPKIHEKVFELLNIKGGYKLFEIEKNNISKLGDAIKLLKIKGVNVTIPYKQTVIKELDYISDEAKAIGAVNTIKLKDNKLYGYNTDYFGFGHLLKSNNIDVINKIAVVLGNGGASKAVCTYLLDNKVKDLYLVTRNKENASNIDNRIKLIDYNELQNIKGDIIINTTPVGMFPKVGFSPVNEEIIKEFNVLVDIIYNPEETEFLKLGKKFGKITCGGLMMLVGQGIKSQEIWQDISIDNKVIDSIFNELKKDFI
ncbi:MAG: shikimate dehydrogenase [Clostridiales bacterium]|nr:shikimate dehydrogenase [Clostridiales bacterium]